MAAAWVIRSASSLSWVPSWAGWYSPQGQLYAVALTQVGLPGDHAGLSARLGCLKESPPLRRRGNTPTPLTHSKAWWQLLVRNGPEFRSKKWFDLSHLRNLDIGAVQCHETALIVYAISKTISITRTYGKVACKACRLCRETDNINIHLKIAGNKA